MKQSKRQAKKAKTGITISRANRRGNKRLAQNTAASQIPHPEGYVKHTPGAKKLW